MAALEASEVEPGHIVMNEGETGDSMFILSSGEVEIVVGTGGGEEGYVLIYMCYCVIIALSFRHARHP